MPQPDRRSLAESLRAAADGMNGRTLSGAGARVALGNVLGLSCLSDQESLAGCSVLVATAGQFMTAIALLELDGLAGRIVLCPPDLKPAQYPALMARAGIDKIVTDLPDETFSEIGPSELVRCTWPLVVCPTLPAFRMATEWLLLTSGTTGEPKMVQHSFAGLTAAIKPRAGSVRQPVWATFYDMRRYGGLQIFLRGIIGTGSMVLSDAGESVSDYLYRLGREGVTHISGTPSHWRRALMSPAIDAIRPDYVRLSGEIADQTVLDSLRQTFPGADIGHAYASTEAGVGFEVDDGLEGFPASYIGRQGTGVDMAIEDGSLRIRSARTATRYVGSDDLELASAGGFIDTGDMIELRGDRYYFVGRRGGIINVGGLKVHPEEVESVINRNPHVRMSLVQGRKNPIMGAIVVAAVVLKDWNGAEPANGGDAVRSEILAECRQTLAPHKVPAVLRFVPSLDVTAAGKLVRAHA